MTDSTSHSDTLTDLHRAWGAALAADGIPLHYGDVAAEVRAAARHAVVMDRSHEGRLTFTERDALPIIERTSTNKVADLPINHAAATIFTSPTGRIIDRVTVIRRADDALLLTEPGRAAPVTAYIQRNIFYNDQATLADVTPTTTTLAVHGPAADGVLVAFDPALADLPLYAGRTLMIGGVSVSIIRVKPVSGAAWLIIVPRDEAATVLRALHKAGAQPAGSLAYNVLRIAAGRPGVGRELSGEYIPLEVALWDEVSFIKGCYTGQEIIARMESRGKLARTLVQVALDAPVDAPAALLHEGRAVGMLTSSVTAPAGTLDVLPASYYGVAVVKVAAAQVGAVLTTEQGVNARVVRLPGAQPAHLTPE